MPPPDALSGFLALYERATLVVGHNVSFDIRMVRILSARITGEKWSCERDQFCTMRRTTNICKILKAQPRCHNDWKWPSLIEAIRHFFGEDHANAHRARADCDGSARIFFHLREQGLIG